MRRVIVESPFAGRTEAIRAEHLSYARRALRDSLDSGEAPLASHLLYTQPGVLDDGTPHERDWGIQAGLQWRYEAEAVIFYTDRGWSPGMLYTRQICERDGIPIEERSIDPNP